MIEYKIKVPLRTEKWSSRLSLSIFPSLLHLFSYTLFLNHRPTSWNLTHSPGLAQTLPVVAPQARPAGGGLRMVLQRISSSREVETALGGVQIPQL